IKAGIFHLDQKASLLDLPETKPAPEFGHLVCHGQWLPQPIPVHGRVKDGRVKDGGNVYYQSDVRHGYLELRLLHCPARTEVRGVAGVRYFRTGPRKLISADWRTTIGGLQCR